MFGMSTLRHAIDWSSGRVCFHAFCADSFGSKEVTHLRKERVLRAASPIEDPGTDNGILKKCQGEHVTII